mmetsp:Transcript_74881/g.229131  ORF Transcript_74881/g.229131 Transcript_74881/m.229131 type:complete len:625 (-) Transcript_74881:325-2199(-)
MAGRISVSAGSHGGLDRVGRPSSSLVGRRVKIVGLASPAGRRLNGQVGGVIKELGEERVGVRLDCGDRSIRKGNLDLSPLRLHEVLDEGRLSVRPHIKQWPAEVVVFFNAQQCKHYRGSPAEVSAQRIHEYWNYDRHRDSVPISTFDLVTLCVQLQTEASLGIRVDPDWVLRLLSMGMYLDLLLKVVLRCLADIDSRYLNALDKNGAGFYGSQELICLLRAAMETGRESEFVGAFDSDDLLRAVWAADRVGFACPSSVYIKPSQDALPALRMLDSSLFRCGVSVRGLAEQARTKFRVICTDGATQTPVTLWPEGEWLRAHMNPDRFDRRLARWCAWEEQQWLLAFALFRTRGLLPATAAARIADSIAGPSEANGQAIQERHTLQLLHVVDIDEPPPQIDAEVAQSQTICDVLDADEMWADRVQRRIQEEQVAPNPMSHATEALGPVERPETVFLLKIGGDNVEGLRQRLLQGPEFNPCRKALLAAPEPRSCELPEKALVFVKPQQYNAVRQALVDKELRYYHIIITEGFEYLLEEALQSFPCRQRATLKKQREALALDPLGDHWCQAFMEARTFLCVPPILAAAHQVGQSTTEAVVDSQFHYSFSRGVNPRRVVSADVTDPSAR